jgi:hypothetical protein
MALSTPVIPSALPSRCRMSSSFVDTTAP